MNDTEFHAALMAFRMDRSHGATELARRALYLLAVSAEDADASSPDDLLADLKRRAQALAKARPSMMPVYNAVAHFERAISRLSGPEPVVRARAASAAREVADAMTSATKAAAREMAALIPKGAQVLTHSYSSTVEAALLACADKGIAVTVTESRPLNEGLKLAKSLHGAGIVVTVITDAQMALAAARCDLAVIGADAVLPDGSVVNKAGSCLLGLAAQGAGCPLYVCTDGFKARPASLGAPDLEEMNGAELGHDLPEGISARNTYFDVVPDITIKAIVGENGPVSMN